MGYAGLRMTAEQFVALGETPERLQLIDGVVSVSPSPHPKHQRLIVEIIYQLEVFRRSGGGIGLFPDTDVCFGSSLVYRPDIAVYAKGRVPGADDVLEYPPDLIVEVLSPSSRPLDLITKRDDYDRYAVAEYWVIDAEDGSIRVWRRTGDRLQEAAETGDSVASAAIPGFTLSLPPIRAIAKTV